MNSPESSQEGWDDHLPQYCEEGIPDSPSRWLSGSTETPECPSRSVLGRLASPQITLPDNTTTTETKQSASAVALKRRKQHILYNLTFSQERRIKRAIEGIQFHARDSKSNSECWFHKEWRRNPDMLKWRGKNIARAFSFGHGHLTMQVSTWAHLVEDRLSSEQKEGLIHGTLGPGQSLEKWFLSHLCGNWPCVNPYHAVVERHSINNARNRCHNGKARCRHSPPCIMGLKLSKGQLHSRTSRSGAIPNFTHQNFPRRPLSPERPASPSSGPIIGQTGLEDSTISTYPITARSPSPDLIITGWKRHSIIDLRTPSPDVDVISPKLTPEANFALPSLSALFGAFH